MKYTQICVSRYLDETFDWDDDYIIEENCPGLRVASGAGFGYRDIEFMLDYALSMKELDVLKDKLVSLIGDNKGLKIE